MAKELVTLTWCDLHLAEKDEQVEATTWHLGKGQVDLCAECAQPFQDAQALVDSYGAVGKRTRTKGKQSGPEDPQTCPVCGKVAKNRDSLASHGRHIHKMNLGELLGDKQDYACPVCGKKFSTPQGAGAHRARSHPATES